MTWTKGHSGNPRGRSKGASKTGRGFAEDRRRLTAQAGVEGRALGAFWWGIVNDKRRAMGLRLEASKLVAAYAFGKPVQPLEGDVLTALTVNIIRPLGVPEPPRPVDGKRLELPSRPPGKAAPSGLDTPATPAEELRRQNEALRARLEQLEAQRGERPPQQAPGPEPDRRRGDGRRDRPEPSA